jgi:ABC-type uncharacterized transport system permease subunit
MPGLVVYLNAAYGLSVMLFCITIIGYISLFTVFRYIGIPLAIFLLIKIITSEKKIPSLNKPYR